MSEQQHFSDLQKKILSVCEESGLELKFEVEEHELEPSQEDTFLTLRKMNPHCAVAVGIKDDYMQRIFMLDKVGDNVYHFAELSQNYTYISQVSLADDGIWDLDELDNAEGENW